MAPIDNGNDQYLDVKKLIAVLKKNWFFYVISIVVFLSLTFVISQLVQPVYEVNSSIYIKENTAFESKKAVEFMQSFQLFDQKRTFQNEMLILRSTPLIKETVEQLNLEIEYNQVERFVKKDLFGREPFNVVYDSSHVQAINVDYELAFFNDGQFRISAEGKDLKLINYSSGELTKTNADMELQGTFFQSDVVQNEYCKFRLYLNPQIDVDDLVGKTYSFRFKDKNAIVKQIAEQLKVQPENPEVSIVELSMKANSPHKAEVFISTLTNFYLKKNLERKNHFAQNTIEYINYQLEEISDSLSYAESQLESFRAGNQVINITSKAGRIYERLQQLEVEKASLDRQLKYYQYLDEFFEENDDLADLVVPSSMGITDQTLNELMRNLITLVNQRNELLGKRQQKSPYLRNLEVQIESLKRPIIENINFSISTLEKTIADLGRQIAEMKRNVEALPKTERQLIGFERKFKLNDAIYTFLLQRRAEAQIARASNLPEHEIVEPAQVVRRVFPNSKINYGVAFILSLIVPSFFILLVRFFDDRIKGEESLDSYKDRAFFGAIIKNKNNAEDVMMSEPTSAIAETFRTIRTNLFYYLKGEEHKSILVTSSIAGEGKSFVSLNLALSLAQMDKKVVLVGFDLRKNNQYSNIITKQEQGLTALYVNNIRLEDLAQKTDYENLDIIAPGVVPPNPAELISNDVTKDLFEYLRSQYDFIVIDSSPVGVVSDALLLAEHADVNVFVVRENYSRKPIVSSVMDELNNKGIERIGLVLNASRMEGKKYRYEYYDKYNALAK
ncbi:MAG: polysaccharide biosynthesis tyrosine autokinase [Carboxylicivirga sp.]|jgi:capsular exopolysaccharide synthesis family protein|nr:polysaccharide biosynthesis tyrosine autokinase [Carboxylicivirga sp.]